MVPEEAARRAIEECAATLEALIHVEFNEPTGQLDWHPMNTHGYREAAQYLRDNQTLIIKKAVGL